MNKFIMTGDIQSSFLEWLAAGMKHIFQSKGFQYDESKVEELKLVFNFISQEQARPFRRKAQATFVVSVLETHGEVQNIFKEAYPFLVRALSNHLMYINHTGVETEIYFLTPEQGCYKLTYIKGDDEQHFFEQIYERLEPLASSQLVIDNEFHPDLPEPLWEGDHVTQKLSQGGKRLDEMKLLPAPFPLDDFLTERDIRHLNKLYGIGGLSYGNLSARRDENNFWMSASGINKADMKNIGQDILYIKGYNETKNNIEVSIPPDVSPKRASVDAIEHWMIYREHPDVGAIVHIHAWMDGIKATEINYPCGTIELAKNVAQLVRESDNPARTIIGLKNHGLTITGPDIEDIFERIDGKITRQVPMS